MTSRRTSLHILPARQEPGYAIFNRLALRHRAPNRQDFAEQIGLVNRSVYEIGLGRNLQTIAELTGIDATTIRHSTFQRDEREGWHFGKEVLAKISNGASAISYGRVCPACILDDIDERAGPTECRPYRRFWWDLSAIYACPIHNLALTSACVACRRVFGIDTLNLGRCECGHSVTRNECRPIQKEHLDANEYIFDRVTNSSSRSNHFLDGLSFRSAIGVLATVGIATDSKTSSRELKTLNEQEKARIMTAGFNAFANWPTSFENVLDKMVSDQAQNKLSPGSAYGKLQQWLNTSRDVDLELIRVAVRGHAIRRIPIKRNTKVFGIKIDGMVTTLGDIGTQCGCSSFRAGTVAEMLGLVDAMTSHEPSVVVPSNIISPLKAFFEASIDPGDAKHYLNVGRKIFLSLVDSGIIRRAFVTKGSIPSRYYKSDLEDILMRLRGNSPMLNQAPTGSAPITQAIKLCFRSSEEIISAMLRGQLRATGQLIGISGIPGILVDTSVVRRVLAHDSKQQVLLIGEAARYLGVSDPTIYALKKAGWLTEIRGFTALHQRSGIDYRCLNELRENYVTSSELSKVPTNPTCPKRIHRILSEAGLEPAFKAKRCVQPLFHRSAAENAVRRYFNLAEQTLATVG